MDHHGAKAPGLFDLRVLLAPRTRWFIGACAVGLVFALWFLATAGRIPEQRWVSPVILPSPIEVARSYLHPRYSFLFPERRRTYEESG